ncbi:MAG TPA: gluconeogenesis factor YvcK family protein [Terriglobia bacterium]|nr:gluconeogenesis factor YvcK family protein [Terriglobia bacterium]
MQVVAIGGGTGLSTLLRGLKHHVDEPVRRAQFSPPITRLTAIVTVTDEGGSSGRLRRELGVLPPGDIRNCLVALAEDEDLFARLFNYRFPNGRGLAGHSFGNLFLTALTRLTRDFAKAVRVSSEVLAIRGEIYPATLSDVRLKARLRNGRTIAGESRINQTRVPIERLEIVPGRCRPLPEALAAIHQADLITVGPGSLYTSLVPNLLVSGIPEEIARSGALKVYVSNLMTQPGETLAYTAAQHLRALSQHAGRQLFDVVVLNSRALSPALEKRYTALDAEPVAHDLEAVRTLGVEPVLADLLEEDHVARHNPRRLAQLLLDLAAHRAAR